MVFARIQRKKRVTNYTQGSVVTARRGRYSSTILPVEGSAVRARPRARATNTIWNMRGEPHAAVGLVWREMHPGPCG